MAELNRKVRMIRQLRAPERRGEELLLADNQCLLLCRFGLHEAQKGKSPKHIPLPEDSLFQAYIHKHPQVFTLPHACTHILMGC